MSVAIVAKASAEETAARMRELPPRAVAAFVTALGSEPSRGRAQTAREAARLVHETDRVAKRVAELAPEARDLFLLCCVGERRRLGSEVEERAWSLRGIPKSRARAALSELVAAGLLVELGDEVAAFPDAVAGCGGVALAWIARAEPDAADALPVPFLLAVLASLVAEESPRLTQQGRPHARWLAKASERMLHPACPPHWTERLLWLGHELGLWCAEDDAQGRRLRPSPVGARAAFALPPEDWAAAVASRSYADAEGLAKYGWTLAERALRRAGADVADLTHVIEESRALAAVAPHVAHPFVPWGAADDVGRIAEGLGLAALDGRIAIDRGPSLSTIRRATPAPTDGRWTVLPNYEVLVPEDAPPAAVFRLACIARLERVDRVAKFVLDRASVSRRGTVEGLDASAVEILAERSAHPLPEVVAAAVAEWDVGAAPLRGFVGAVVVASSREQLEALRRDEDAPKEIAPGVFFVGETRLQTVLDRARRAGVAVGPVERRGRWDGRVGDERAGPGLPDLVRAAAEFRARFAAVVEAKPKPAPEKRRRTDVARADGPGGGAAAEVRERLAELLGVGADLLRSKWPHVYAAVADRPELLRRAQRLPHDLLRAIGRSRSGPAIRDRVFRASLEWEKELRQGSASEFVESLERLAGADESDDEAWIMTSDDFFGEDDEDDDVDPPPRSAAAPKSRLRLVGGPAGAAPAHAADPTWQAPPPGELRQRLAEAVRTKATVEILYANSEGIRRGRTVRPAAVRAAGGHDWLDAAEPAAGTTVSFRLDRIAAIRG